MCVYVCMYMCVYLIIYNVHVLCIYRPNVKTKVIKTCAPPGVNS